jgi:hypothetical protein
MTTKIQVVGDDDGKGSKRKKNGGRTFEQIIE